MTRKICIISGKGGVGKTVVTANLAAALMKLNKNVIAIDTDIRMPGLGLQLGMYQFPVTLNDVLRGKAKLIEAVYMHPSGLRFVPASIRIEDIGLMRLPQILENSTLADHIAVVDTPPGMDKSVMTAIRACDEAIIVTAPELPAVVDVMKVASVAKNLKCNVTGIIVNRQRKGCKEQILPEEIEAVSGIPVIGVIPEDANVTKSIFQKTPEVVRNPYSDLSIEFNRIASRITGNLFERPKRMGIKRLLRRFGT